MPLSPYVLLSNKWAANIYHSSIAKNSLLDFEIAFNKILRRRFLTL